MPLYFAGHQQIDAVVPYDVAPNSAQQMIVQNGSAYSQPETVYVGAAQPGVFTQDASGTGPGAILGQKPGGIAALNTAANPASAGDALVIFCTGLGTVHPPVPAGAAATPTLSYQHGHGDRGREGRAGSFRRTGSGMGGAVSGEHACAARHRRGAERAGCGDGGGGSEYTGDGRDPIGRPRPRYRSQCTRSVPTETGPRSRLYAGLAMRW